MPERGGVPEGMVQSPGFIAKSPDHYYPFEESKTVVQDYLNEKINPTSASKITMYNPLKPKDYCDQLE